MIVVDQRYYTGGLSQYTFPEAFSGLLEVQSDDEYISVNSIDIDKVNLQPTSSSSVITMTLYNSETPSEIKMVTNNLVYNANKTWQLSNLPLTRPYHACVIVEVNGQRLTPARTFYTRYENNHFVDSNDHTIMKVYDLPTSNGFSVIPIQSLTSDILQTPEEVIAIAGNNRFILWEERIVFADQDAGTRSYSISVNENSDFTISDTGELVITKNISSGDDIRVTYWTNSTKMKIKTNVYSGNTEGVYPIKTSFNGKPWLTVDGKRLTENVDYKIVGKSGSGWDVDAYDGFSYDSNRTVQVALRLPGENPSSKIVITTFEGRENNSASSWLMSSRVPSEIQFIQSEDQELLMFRDAYELTSLDVFRRSGTIINSNDDSITIDIDDSDLFVSDCFDFNNVGVIWVNGERIEYFKSEKSNNTVTLSQLRRGTRGTSKLNHNQGDMVISGNYPLDRMPKCPLDTTTDLFYLNHEIDPPLFPDSDIPV